ncbi:MAG: tRNA preQ1(34) S-adenosylmethionine ribosyltransferase-isomerase QueA [Candidatus Zixiibacteriota bacterium]|nr:MAG: tRNA preQ1(34) S-adenosylmethionine ribosyltransferase-isomerase QueA [candidate division Zixibacteria bacterium]
MDVSLFDYHLPKELIAQFPARRREQSRMLLLDRGGTDFRHERFQGFPDYLKMGDALVVNNTRVFKARLLGKRITGGKVEVFLIRRLDDEPGEVWEAMARPSRRLKEGERVFFDDKLSLELLTDMNNGRWQVLFGSPTACARIISRYGHVPLPQYIGREDQPSDIRRYQTVYADKNRSGAVAAPTAGFHFTRSLLDRLKAGGVTVLEVTLHVGPGTFKPIQTDNIEKHTVDAEYAELPAHVAATLNQVRDRGGAVFAVGTTTVRTLESADYVNGEIQPFGGMTDLYIKPGHQFRSFDHLVTNFHLPKSSLLVLVAALVGRERILEAYAEAVCERYRFYSYGDAMLIL